MQKKWYLIVLILILLGGAVEATLTCDLKETCGGGETDFGGLFQLNNSHFQLNSNSDYTNRICCSDSLTSIDDSCSGNASNKILFNAFQQNNSHVQDPENSDYTNQVCLGISAGSISTDVVSGNCDSYDTCVVRMYAQNNSHLAACNETDATYSVCASVAQVFVAVPEFSDFGFLTMLIIILGIIIIKQSRGGENE